MAARFVIIRAMKVLFLVSVSCLLLVSCSAQPTYRDAPRSGQEVVVEVKTLTPEVPVFFTYRYGGKKVNFFVVKMNDRVLSFLDACARCYPGKRGYRYSDGRLICRECDVKYAISEIEKGFGSCFPIRIEGSLRAGEYRIPLSVLERMADKF